MGQPSTPTPRRAAPSPAGGHWRCRHQRWSHREPPSCRARWRWRRRRRSTQVSADRAAALCAPHNPGKHKPGCPGRATRSDPAQGWEERCLWPARGSRTVKLEGSKTPCPSAPTTNWWCSHLRGKKSSSAHLVLGMGGCPCCWSSRNGSGPLFKAAAAAGCSAAGWLGVGIMLGRRSQRRGKHPKPPSSIE